MKQTAVEWLVNSLSELEHTKHLYKLIDYRIKKQKLIDQAKQMEKEQIIEAHLDGQSLVSCKDEYAELYYNETFKSE
jgi:hypothetical protein